MGFIVLRHLLPAIEIHDKCESGSQSLRQRRRRSHNPHTRMLTDTKLRTLSHAQPFTIADSGGLAIEVKPTGTRLWRYRFRYNGKASMTSFGEYPATSLSEARALRDQARKTLLLETSPVVAAWARRMAALEHAGNTFAVIAAEFLDQHTKSLSPTGAARSRRLFEKDLKPYLGNIAITA